MLEHPPHQRVSRLVESDHAALVGVDDEVLLLEAGDHAVDRRVERLGVDGRRPPPRGDQGGLVAHVGHLGAREAGREPRELLRHSLDRLTLGELQRLEMHGEDLLATLDVRLVHHHLPVEAAGAEERRVEDVGAVGPREHHDPRARREPVELDEQSVQSVLALVVPAREAALAARAADGVDLVDEDEARRVGARLREEVAHARRADADEHLDEIGAGD